MSGGGVMSDGAIIWIEQLKGRIDKCHRHVSHMPNFGP